MATCHFRSVFVKSLPIIMLSSVLLWAVAASGFCSLIVADSSKTSDSYINYTTVTGYFLQDELATNASTFNFMTTNFGLINRTYPADSTLHSPHNLTQWQRFKHQITQLNRKAPRGTEYKLLYMGRHGDGYHNDAQAYYGTPAWNCYYSELDGNSSVTWSDAHLSPLGVAQALAVNEFWASEIKNQKIPTPQSYYTSPLTRCLQTANYTFNGLDLPARHLFIPQVKEYFREGISGHTCDRRSNETYIHNLFPSYRIEPGFTEDDELWVALHGETSTDQGVRSKRVLDSVFSTDDSTYISITSHSGEIGSILSGQLLSKSPPTCPLIVIWYSSWSPAVRIEYRCCDSRARESSDHWRHSACDSSPAVYRALYMHIAACGDCHHFRLCIPAGRDFTRYLVIISIVQINRILAGHARIAVIRLHNLFASTRYPCALHQVFAYCSPMYL